MRSRLLLSGALVASVLLARPGAAPGATADPWMQPRATAARTAVNSQESTLNAASVARLRVTWTYVPAGTPTPSSGVVVAGGTAYAVSSGSLVALDADTGAVRWARNIGPSDLAPVATASRVVVVNRAGEMTVYTTTGAVVWRTHLQGSSPRQPVIASGTIFVTSGERWSAVERPRVEAFNLSSGVRRWVAGPAHTAPAVASGRVLVGGGGLRAFAVADGRLLWRQHIPGEMDEMHDPVAAAGVVTMVSAGDQGRIDRLPLGDGDPRERVFYEYGAYGTQLTMARGLVAEVVRDQQWALDAPFTIAALVVRDPGTLAVRWQVPVHASRHTDPSVAGQLVYVVDNQRLEVYGPTGTLLRAVGIGGPASAQPSIANGWVYVPRQDGAVIALALA